MRLRGLARLDQLLTLPPDAGLPAEIVQPFRRNFVVNSLDMMTFLFGVSFVSVQAILPVYARRLTDSAILIGLIPALTDAGWFLPQLFLAPLIERLPRKLPLVLCLGALERGSFLLLPLAALWLPSLAPTLAISVFILLMAVKSVSAGFVAAPWQEMLAKLIPVSHRGRFFGLARFAGQLLGIGGAALATLLLGWLPYPQNFALSFTVGAVGIWASLGFQALTREPAQAPAPRPAQSRGDYVRRLSEILKRNANFRTYLVSRWLAYFGGMAFGFIAVSAVERFDLADSVAGLFTALFNGASVIGYAVWGPLGDRLGHKRVMEAASALWLAALLVAVFSPAAWGYYLAFALMGFSNAGGILSDLNIAMEFGPEAERPTYIGLTRTVTGPALLIAPLLGGWIAQTWGYSMQFITSFAFAACGLALLRMRVKEPRHLARPIAAGAAH